MSDTLPHPAALRQDADRYKQAQKSLCARVRQFASLSGRTPEAVSYKVFLDRRQLVRIEEGASLSPRVFTECLDRLEALEAQLNQLVAA